MPLVYVCTLSLSPVRLCVTPWTPGSSVYAISPERILEWVASFLSRGPFYPGIKPTSPVSPALTVGFSNCWILHHCTTWEAPVYLPMTSKLLLRTKQDVIYYFPSSVSCPILFPHFLSQMSCDIPVDISPTGKESDCMLSHFSHVRLWATLWTAACQAPLSMGFSKQEYWSGLPCPLPGDLPDPGIKPVSQVYLH